MSQMQKPLLLLISLLFSIIIHAQDERKLDSLKAVLETNIHDTTRLKVLTDVALEYCKSDSAQAYQYYKKLKKVSEALNKTNRLLYVQFDYAWLLMNMGHYARAEDLLQSGLKLAQQTSNLKREGNMLQALGRLERIRGNYDEATEYYFQYRSVAEKLGQAKQILLADQGLGIIKFLQGNYSEALPYFQKSLKMSIEAKEGRDMANNYTNIGNVYHYQGNYSKGLEYFLKALKYHEEQKDKVNISFCLENIGNLYRDQKDYTQALAYLTKSLEIQQELKRTEDIALILINIGSVYHLQQDYTQASQHYYQVLAIAQKLDSKRYTAQSTRGIGEIQLLTDSLLQAEKSLEIARKLFEELGEQEYLAGIKVQLGTLYGKKENYGKALTFLEESIQYSSKNKDKDLLRDATEQLAQIHSKTGNYKDAFNSYVLFKQLSDSLLNEENTKKVTQQAMQYEFDKEKADINLKNQQQQLEQKQQLQEQRYILLGTGVGLVLTLLLAIVVYRNYRNKQRANQLLTEQNEEIKLQREEIQLQAEELKTSNEKLLALSSFKEDMTGMLVHDLKNPLNTIVHAVQEYNPENNQKIRQAGNQLHNMVLNILDVYKYENSQMIVEQSKVDLKEVMTKAIEDTSLLAYNKSIEVKNNLEQRIIIKADKEIIVRVISNLLTNAIKYTPQNGKVLIDAAVNNDQMVSIRITDSGKGIEAKNLRSIFDKFSQIEAKKSGVMRSTGLGLTFCKMAVEAHKGEISAISEIGKGTSFTFTLPLIATTPTEKTTALAQKPQMLITLTSEEKEILKPIVNKLSQTLVFEVGEVKEMLRNIEARTPNITHWENEIKQSVSLLNEERYQQLIRLAAK